MNFLNRTTATLFLVLALAACQPANKAEVKDDAVADSLIHFDLDSVDNNGASYSEASVSLYLSIPPPVEVANLLKNSGATYNPAVLNAENKVNKYQTLVENAVNIGVYSSDMAYSNAFDHKQEALKYFAAVRKLSEKLGLESVFSKNLQNRISANENRQDSLDQIFSETYTLLEEKLTATQREMYFALMVTGGWLEGMHIATEIWSANKSAALADMVSNQRQALNSLLEIIGKYEKEEAFAKVYPALQKIKAAYGEGEGKLDEKKMKEIQTLVSALRKDLVK